MGESECLINENPTQETLDSKIAPHEPIYRHLL